MTDPAAAFDGPVAARRGVIEVTNPATLAKVADVPVTDEAGVRDAIARGREAQARWRCLTFAERGTVLKRFRDVIIDHKDRIADTITAETGKPRAEAFAAELFYVCDAIGYWAKHAAEFLADQTVRPHLMKTKAAYSTYKPLGVVGVIGPWNFPLALTVGEGLPALMAGNALIIKPSEITPRSAMVAAELWEAVRLFPGLLQVVPGFGATGSSLVDHADMICFTGSVATGKKVAERAARRLIPVTLELGGKDPMIVLRDADLERAANGCVWGGVFNAGQVCMTGRIVQPSSRLDHRFVTMASSIPRAEGLRPARMRLIPRRISRTENRSAPQRLDSAYVPVV